MSSKRILTLAGSTLLAGGLLAGSVGWVAAQDHPMTGMGSADHHRTGMMTDAARYEATDGMMGGMMHGMMHGMMAHMMGGTMPDEAGRGGMGGMMTDQHTQMDGMMAHMMGDTTPGRTGYGAMGGTIDDHQTEMHAAVAEALGLTVDEFEAALESGKMLPQIAEEQGVDLEDLHETVMSEFDMHGR